MERWRSYFGKSGTDIWTIIHQAIILAAADHPEHFRERRGEIAETLFARKLGQPHVKDDPTPIPEEIDIRNGENRGTCIPTDAYYGTSFPDDGAEGLSEEMKEEASTLQELHSMKGIIADPDQSEIVILDALQRLQCMQISVETLKATDIGRHVNSLKKHVSKRLRAIAKELVRHWKMMVDEWANSATDVMAEATKAHPTGTADKHEEGLASPPLDDLEAIMDMSQSFSFMDREMCTGNKDVRNSSSSIERSIKDRLHNSQLGASILTDSSDFDTKASTNRPWGLRTPEERGSATRDVYPPTGKPRGRQSAPRGPYEQCEKDHAGWNNDSVQVSRGVASGSGPGRPCDVPQAKPAPGQINTRNPTCNSIQSGFGTTHTSSANKSSLLTADKRQVDPKLEITKRKLHQGYQRAENEKKQRTVQVLDLPDLPKTTTTLQEGKMNGPPRSKAGLQSGYGSLKKRFA